MDDLHLMLRVAAMMARGSRGRIDGAEADGSSQGWLWVYSGKRQLEERMVKSWTMTEANVMTVSSRSLTYPKCREACLEEEEIHTIGNQLITDQVLSM